MAHTTSDWPRRASPAANIQGNAEFFEHWIGSWTGESQRQKDQVDFHLVISILNNRNDAFQQVHRQRPVIIDFRGPSAKEDRQNLLLHRLFENRRNIPDSDIAHVSSVYASERFRLLHANKTAIPFPGETKIYELVLNIAAKGELTLATASAASA
jgi:hypothetical protein